MSDITVTFKNETILTMDASGSKPLLTRGKYCEDDIAIAYVKPAGPSGTKQISIIQNGTVTEDVAAYANAEITVNVQGGAGAPYELGTVTIAEDTQILTVPVTQLYNRFIVCRFDKKADWTYAASLIRNVVFVYGSASEYTVCDTNNTGGSIYLFDRTPDLRGGIAFTASQITAKALGNGGPAAFPAGSTYVWAAFNAVST